ncbi:MAG: methyltransferase [Defluviitaleaceae bacterium]|nr:methyltransferase [Defluviitaleaceae bacterium]
MSHYFIENHEVLTQDREIPLEIFGHRLGFLTNNGLFSCDKIDDASLILIQNMPPVKGAFLDLGCGYGVIGISLAKTNEIVLTQSDINSLALSYAQKNAARNGVIATLIHSDSFEKINGKFETITLNPPIHAGKDVMYRMYEDSAAHLTPDGAFYIVIQKKHGAESSIKKLKTIFKYVEIIYKKKSLFVVRSHA